METIELQGVALSGTVQCLQICPVACTLSLFSLPHVLIYSSSRLKVSATCYKLLSLRKRRIPTLYPAHSTMLVEHTTRCVSLPCRVVFIHYMYIAAWIMCILLTIHAWVKLARTQSKSCMLHICLGRAKNTSLLVASYPGLLTPAFVACSTNAGGGKTNHVQWHTW